MQASRPPIEEGQGFAIDASRAPEAVIVTAHGALNRARFQAMLEGLAAKMDELVGPGRAFLPIVFDMSCSRMGADMTLPAFREAERPLVRRYRKVAFVVSEVTQTDLFNFLMAVFTALAPGAQRAENLEQAIQLLTAKAPDAASN